MTTDSAAKGAGAKQPDGEIAPIVIDLGSKTRKSVKRMRKGTGKLMDDVMESIQELKEGGEIGKDAQPVIVVVRQKKRKCKGFPFSIM
jgi:hypothetical protein